MRKVIGGILVPRSNEEMGFHSASAIEFMLTFTRSIKQRLRIKYVTITGGAKVIAKVIRLTNAFYRLLI